MRPGGAESYNNRPWGGEGGEGYGDWRMTDAGTDFGGYRRTPPSRQEDPDMMLANMCWEKASKVLKKPGKGLVIPPAENLMYYLESKYSNANWGQGDPVATRSYPNGSVFVAQYENGGGRVYYPHGGLAMAISGPSPGKLLMESELNWKVLLVALC